MCVYSDNDTDVFLLKIITNNNIIFHNVNVNDYTLTLADVLSQHREYLKCCSIAELTQHNLSVYVIDKEMGMVHVMYNYTLYLHLNGLNDYSITV